MKSKKNYYIGMENKNNQGWVMKIVEYNNYNDIVVEFAPPYIYQVTTRVDRFIRGNVQNPYAPTICGFGIVGNKYPTHVNSNIHLKEYSMWRNLILRCYDEKNRYRNPSYANCTCCNDWQYYETFYEWLHNQENFDVLLSINDIAIDKDILIKRNKEYAPDKCCLVPKCINNLLLKSDKIRGDCSIGVFYHKRNGTYIASCGGHDNYHYIGSFQTEIDAFNAYKKYKEAMIKKIAKEEYELKHITEQCYNALLNYQVEITD